MIFWAILAVIFSIVVWINLGSQRSILSTLPTKAMLIQCGIIVLGLATSIPVYLYLGKPAIAEFAADHKDVDFSNPNASSAFMLNELKKAVLKSPDDILLRQNLTRSYLILGLYAEAKASGKELLQISPDNVNSILIMADIVVASNRGIFNQEASQLVSKVLEIEPENSNGLILKGLDLKQKNKINEALVAWRGALATLPQSSNLKKELHLLIAAESQAMGETKADRKTATPNTFNLSVKVTKDRALNTKWNDQSTIFITTHYLDSPRIPITASRRSAGELPLEIIINEKSLMGARTNLDATRSIFVKVRVSESGDTREQKSDTSVVSKSFLILEKNRVELSLP
jgi:cytochrome c-type biogenesis protein CcmH